MPLIDHYVPFRTLHARSDIIAMIAGNRTTIRESRFEAAHVDLLRDPVFEGILHNRLINIIAVLVEAEALAETLDGILGMIDSELGRG